MKKLPTKDVVAKFVAIHGNTYDYSRVEYVSMHQKVTIICQEHGPFEQTPHSHLKGVGCKACGFRRRAEGNRLKQDEVIARFVAKHGNRYDYSQSVYVAADQKLTVICREHGPFYPTPNNHMAGSGCPKCGYESVSAKLSNTQEDIIARFIEKHGAKYDYSKVVYDGLHTDVEIICPTHGSFMQAPSEHLTWGACPQCSKRMLKKLPNATERLIEAFKETHGDKYDYTKVEYRGAGEKVEIVCPEHGSFFQLSRDHINGHGCTKCYTDTISDRCKKSTDEVINEFVAVHGDRYDYSRVEYKTTHDQVEIVCKEHGPFFQVAKTHVGGCGCPLCVNLKNPKANQEIAELVRSFGHTPIREYQFNGDRRSIDVFEPETSLGIEHNGLIWHSEMYRSDARQHMAKKKADAAAKGIRLIHIMEDEWRDRRPACEMLIAHALGKCERINARDCQYEERPRGDKEAEDFLNATHIQGASNAAFYAVLKYQDRMVMVMSLDMLRSNRKNSDRNKWELVRMASSVQVRGGATKLLTNLLRNHPEINHITTYCDHRLFDGRTYGLMGFTKTAEYGPDYSYVIGGNRHHKSKFQKKRIAAQFGIDMTDRTERDAMAELGYFRIWDCGKSRYELIR